MSIPTILRDVRHGVFGGLIAFGLLVGTGVLVGCAPNEATGDEGFTFMSEAEEDQIGREEHPKILEQFGGAYTDPAIQKYVTSLGGLLKSTTERPDRTYTFTVLDSHVVNAFALPGGYVYVTRGLMALANDEAELAGVVGHEIGHVVARHSAQRQTQGTLWGLGAAILGAVTKSDIVGQIAQVGAAAYVQGFSRDQEFEADQLGIRYMTKAGFEPSAMSTFLSSLEGEDQLARKQAGREGTEPETSLFASHPRTADRVAIAAKTAAASAGGPIGRDRNLYLKKIDGMIFGDSPAQGFVRGRNFAHPQLKFTFDAPPGFRLDNTQAAVVGRVKGDKAIMRFDGVRTRGAGSLIQFITQEWAPKSRVTDLEEFAINGLEAATGTTVLNTQGGRREIRLVAIRFDGNQLYRFALIGESEIGRELDEQFRETVFSFRRLTDREAAQLKPRHIKVVAVAKGDTPERLAQRMKVDELPLETFLSLNGLQPGARLTPGSQVKLVVGGSTR